MYVVFFLRFSALHCWVCITVLGGYFKVSVTVNVGFCVLFCTFQVRTK